MKNLIFLSKLNLRIKLFPQRSLSYIREIDPPPQHNRPPWAVFHIHTYHFPCWRIDSHKKNSRGLNNTIMMPRSKFYWLCKFVSFTTLSDRFPPKSDGQIVANSNLLQILGSQFFRVKKHSTSVPNNSLRQFVEKVKVLFSFLSKVDRSIVRIVFRKIPKREERFYLRRTRLYAFWD